MFAHSRSACVRTCGAAHSHVVSSRVTLPRRFALLLLAGCTGAPPAPVGGRASGRSRCSGARPAAYRSVIGAICEPAPARSVRMAARTMSASRRRRSHEAPCIFGHLVAALLLGALLLGGCASFSPDGGLVAVNAITAPALGQEAVAVRTPEQAEAVSPSRQGAVAPAAHRRSRRADRAAQQPRAASRLQRARAFRSRDGAGEPAAQSDLLAGTDRGRGRARNRGPHRRKPACSLRRCPRAPKSRRSVSGRRSFRRRRKPCASPAKRAAPFIARSPRARLSPTLAQARETGQTAAELAKRLGETGAMNKLDQARNQAFYAEMVAQLGDRAPARGFRTRAAGARAWSLGR